MVMERSPDAASRTEAKSRRVAIGPMVVAGPALDASQLLDRPPRRRIAHGRPLPVGLTPVGSATVQ